MSEKAAAKYGRDASHLREILKERDQVQKSNAAAHSAAKSSALDDLRARVAELWEAQVSGGDGAPRLRCGVADVGSLLFVLQEERLVRRQITAERLEMERMRKLRLDAIVRERVPGKR